MKRINKIILVLMLGFWHISGISKTNEAQRIFLSGTDNENTKTWEFYCTSGRKSGMWTKIEVPSHWEQQGFGEYDYGRDYRTYGKKFKFSDEKGIYKYSFNVPENWKNRIIKIVFEGSMTDTEVKINDKIAGEIHQGAFYRFGYDITDKIKFGSENILEVTVSKMSDDESVNRAERFADYWIFGGIYRPVYLESFPDEYIERAAIDAKADGSFSIDLFPSKLSGKRIIQAEIYNPDNLLLKTSRISSSRADSIINLNFKVDKPKLWTAETPNLYSVKYKILNGKKEIFSASEKFGFRTIEIRQGDGIYLNGVKIKMKGINRHAFWPETGRSLNNKINLEDVKLMKAMNMNAVRCSHYPPDKVFLNYCDSLGLYVINELAGWQNAYSTKVGEKLVKEMVTRDCNHPSIIFWSNGNEGGTNKELDDDFGIYDKSNRPVIHCHHKPGNDFNGIDCNHYENYYSSKKILEEGNIYMPTEFLHAQDDGGGAASLADYWELFWKTENAAGGFLWVLTDEGIVRTDMGGVIDVNRVNAPDGIVGPYREKEGSYYAIREIYNPVKILTKEINDLFDGTLKLENRFHFTNLESCKFEWELVNFKNITKRSIGYDIIKSGTASSPDIEPHKSGELKINLPENFKNFDALYLKAFSPQGEEIYCWSFKLKVHENVIRNIIKLNLDENELGTRKKLVSQGIEEDNILPIEAQEANSKIVRLLTEIIESDSLYTLKASGIAVSFSKKTGLIRMVTNDLGLPIPISNGPVLVAGNSKLESINSISEDNFVRLEMNYSGDIKSLIWTMYSSGWLALQYEYFVSEPQMFTGISFNFPESDIISSKWLGKGPAHVWKNRLQGGKLDVYNRLYNNSLPADNGNRQTQFKGYFDDVCWMEFNTVNGKFTFVSDKNNLFVRLFDFYGISGSKNYPVLPVGNISFLDNIPPIGSKLAMGISNDTWNLGLSGELNIMSKPIKRSLYFYFGLLD